VLLFDGGMGNLLNFSRELARMPGQPSRDRRITVSASLLLGDALIGDGDSPPTLRIAGYTTDFLCGTVALSMLINSRNGPGTGLTPRWPSRWLPTSLEPGRVAIAGLSDDVT
jgi:hypothetical protein